MPETVDPDILECIGERTGKTLVVVRNNSRRWRFGPDTCKRWPALT